MTETVSTPEAPAPAPAPSLPVFYKNPMPVMAARHGKAGLRAHSGFGFARDTNGIAITGSEFALAARHYAIAFSTGQSVVPFAIVGLREKENLFVTPEGGWHPETYIPAYVRRYPFIFNREPGSDRLILCVDEGADRFDPEGGVEPFFNGDKPNAIITEALRFCESFHAQYEDTLQFGKWLEDNQLLEVRTVRVTMKDGEVFSLGGFRLVNPEKVGVLTDEQILFLHKRGWLPLLHFHLQSLNNWGMLAWLHLEAKQRAAAAAA